MQDIFERMQKIISEQFSVDAETVTEDTSFEEDLGADSVDLVELVMAMRTSSRSAKSGRRSWPLSPPWATASIS